MKSRKTLLLGVSAGLLIGVVAALVLLFVVQPLQAKKVANNALENLGVERGSVVATNTELFPFEGDNPLDLKTPQKGLGINKITEPPAFIFGDSGKTLEVYADFGGQRSREFFLVNQNLLSSMISSGQLTLVVYPVVGDNPYDIYAAEAIGEAFVLAPEQAWDFFIETLKNGAEVSSRDDILNSLTNLGIKFDIPLDAISLNNGTLASWILSGVSHSTGKTVPSLLLDGQSLPDDIAITDTEALKEVLRGV